MMRRRWHNTVGGDVRGLLRTGPREVSRLGLVAAAARERRQHGSVGCSSGLLMVLHDSGRKKVVEHI
ncbi:hypothetical protein E2562_037767 [Oryza meyeriana var. granulata]|uniref:Uncharacterized protein n=1 Tax=Oryza meyeriana var. granulata TaxID=110450 RepID=A0A6G1C2K8_9ORYZ|nr:hypothetical protein E2562_037767 [Oryza meyeriana var. granulata]